MLPAESSAHHTVCVMSFRFEVTSAGRRGLDSVQEALRRRGVGEARIDLQGLLEFHTSLVGCAEFVLRESQVVQDRHRSPGALDPAAAKIV